MSKSAWDRMMGYLGRRDHSVLELRQKLSQHHDPEDVIAALKKAHSLNLIPDSTQMAKRTAEALLRKGKGSRYIAGYLKKKGLPNSKVDGDDELDRATRVVVDQLRFEPPFTHEEKKKIFRYLSNRGFSSEVTRAVANMGVRK